MSDDAVNRLASTREAQLLKFWSKVVLYLVACYSTLVVVVGCWLLVGWVGGGKEKVNQVEISKVCE